MKLKEIVIRPDIAEYKSEYRGLKVCLDGNFEIKDIHGDPLSWEEIKRVLELGRVIVHNSFQEDTEMVIAADPDDYSEAVMFALQKGIMVVSEQEFWRLNKQLINYAVIKC